MAQTIKTNTQAVIRRREINMLLVLCALCVMPIYLYGIQVLWIIASAVVTAFAAEYACTLLRGQRRIQKGDFSYLITALITALLMPASAPVWMVVAAVLFGICIAKHPFGGKGMNIFNPAAAGIAFVTICWPQVMNQYPQPLSQTLIFSTTPASTLRVGGTPNIGVFDLLLGNFAGPMGATVMIVLAACLLFLIFRRTVSLRVIVPVIAIVGFCAVFFPRLMTGRMHSLEFEFASGALVFGLTFMASDPCTLPKTGSGKIIYGVLLGIFVVLMRRFGSFDVEFVFALLLANAFSPSCDRYARKLRFVWSRMKRRLRKSHHHAQASAEKAGDAVE